eukprot:SAG11_NODE_16539_length_544_cov_8.280899_2_plen_44_part_01
MAVVTTAAADRVDAVVVDAVIAVIIVLTGVEPVMSCREASVYVN